MWERPSRHEGLRPRSDRPGPEPRQRWITLSTESILTATSSAAAPAACSACGAPVADDQRYCLECGHRLVPMSSVLAGGPPSGPPDAGSSPPSSPPGSPGGARAEQRSQTPAVIAGVGVLLLAMGVGVLIGRSSVSKQPASPAPVITVDSGGTASTGPTSGEAIFSGSWPAGTNGYTVQLQTLPATGSTVAEVDTAKASAATKGAKAVGALKSEEFSSLTSGTYVIYSGIYHTRGEAVKALGGLRSSFPSAKVIQVSNGGSGGSGSTAGTSPSSPSGTVGSSESHPAPSSVLNSLKSAKGKTYEEKSKDLPDVVEG